MSVFAETHMPLLNVRKVFGLSKFCETVHMLSERSLLE